MGVRLAVLTSKFIDSSGRIDDLLLAGIERMTSGAYVQVQAGIGKRRARLESVAAAAGDGDFLIGGMNVGFHCIVAANTLKRGAILGPDDDNFKVHSGRRRPDRDAPGGGEAGGRRRRIDLSPTGALDAESAVASAVEVIHKIKTATKSE